MIPRDSRMIALLDGANRDPEKFPEPDRFDIGRSPNEHLAFGGGVHHCLGAHLARMEAQEAIVALATRTRAIELLDGNAQLGTLAVPRAGRAAGAPLGGLIRERWRSSPCGRVA